MPDTTTPILDLTRPEDGGSEDTWGVKLNADLDILDAAIGLMKVPQALATAPGNLDLEANCRFEITLDSGSVETYTMINPPGDDGDVMEVDIHVTLSGSGGTFALALTGGTLVWSGAGVDPRVSTAGRHWIKVLVQNKSATVVGVATYLGQSGGSPVSFTQLTDPSGVTNIDVSSGNGEFRIHKTVTGNTTLGFYNIDECMPNSGDHRTLRLAILNASDSLLTFSPTLSGEIDVTYLGGDENLVFSAGVAGFMTVDLYRVGSTVYAFVHSTGMTTV